LRTVALGFRRSEYGSTKTKRAFRIAEYPTKTEALPSRLMRRSLVAAVLLTIGCALARAVVSPAAAADPPPIPAEVVRLKVESANYSPGRDALDVLLLAEIAEGWHVNAHRPTSDVLIPTTLSVTPPPGFEVGEIEYPAAERRALGFASGETLLLYSGDVRFRVPLAVKTALTQQ